MPDHEFVLQGVESTSRLCIYGLLGEWRGKGEGCEDEIPLKLKQKNKERNSFSLSDGRKELTVRKVEVQPKRLAWTSCSLLQRETRDVNCACVSTFMHEWNTTPVDGTSCCPVSYLWCWRAGQVLICLHWIFWLTNLKKTQWTPIPVVYLSPPPL